jgi:LmbE family N-acetylglucosaminyl deacetylase
MTRPSFSEGILALLARGGVTVHVVSATRGEGGETGEPPVCTHDELGEVREKEMRCAVETLGARSLSFLGYRDPEMKSGEEFFAFTDRPERAAKKLSSLLRARPIHAVVTHGSSGEYGHPGHRLAHQVARLAVGQRRRQPWALWLQRLLPGASPAAHIEP